MHLTCINKVLMLTEIQLDTDIESFCRFYEGKLKKMLGMCQYGL